MFNPFHDAADVWINDAVVEFKALPCFVETEKERMLKIPGNINATPAVVLRAGVKPMNKERAKA